MSRHDANGDEMRLRRPYDTDDAEFASLAEEIRSACLGAPGPDPEARHLQMILERARTVPEAPVVNSPTARRARRAGVLMKAGIAAAGLAVLTGSLAVAGVDLPLLPDRADDKSRGSRQDTSVPDAGDGNEGGNEAAERVRATIEANLPLVRAGDISGCEFGAMVSAAARGVEPDMSGCEGDDDGEEGEPGSGRSETAQRVGATIEEILPLLHAGDISGCEFGAMVSAAARGVEPDTSRCEPASGGAGAGMKNSKALKEKGGSAVEEPAPAEGSGPKKSQGKKQAAEDHPAPPEDEGAAAKKNEKADTKGEAKGQGTDEAPGQGKVKGKGAPPADKPGGKSSGD